VDTVPADVQAHPLDLWIIAEAGVDVRIKVQGSGSLVLEAPLIQLKTTGQASTSKIILDGVPFSGLTLQSAAGATVGPPVSGPLGVDALAAVASWEAGEGAP
jgi:hypothetical protein